MQSQVRDFDAPASGLQSELSTFVPPVKSIDQQDSLSDMKESPIARAFEKAVAAQKAQSDEYDQAWELIQT